MNGDFSRSTYRPINHYSSVRLQQGRVLLDAEWNEQADIVAHVDRTTTSDVVGPTGAPKSAPGVFANFAVALEPNHPDCLSLLAVILAQQGRTDEAMLTHRAASSVGRPAPETHLRMGTLLSQHGAIADARVCFEAALAVDPDFVPALLNLAKLREDHGRRDEALSLYRKVLALEPTCFEALARFANAHAPGECDTDLTQRLRAALANANATETDRAALGFALGRALDDRAAFHGAA